MYNISKLHREQLTVQYQQATQTAVNCTISASYTDSSKLYNISKLQREQLTVQYQQATQTAVNCTILASYTDSS